MVLRLPGQQPEAPPQQPVSQQQQPAPQQQPGLAGSPAPPPVLGGGSQDAAPRQPASEHQPAPQQQHGLGASPAPPVLGGDSQDASPQQPASQVRQQPAPQQRPGLAGSPTPPVLGGDSQAPAPQQQLASQQQPPAQQLHGCVVLHASEVDLYRIVQPLDLSLFKSHFVPSIQRALAETSASLPSLGARPQRSTYAKAVCTWVCSQLMRAACPQISAWQVAFMRQCMARG